ncbi:MAG: hypothetical protein KDJ16_02915, partial [Hyphomicrobiales bacterium]|nr:hypothetical protein [Hyphomicrobiales bacterium]
ALTPKQLDEAVERGVISAEQAAEIAAISDDESATSRAGSERFRFIDNFADVFICVGQFILMSAAGSLSTFSPSLGPVTVFVIFAALNWVMLEYFGLRNRKYAPAVVAALLSAYSAAMAYAIYSGTFGVFLSGAITNDAGVSGIMAAVLLAAFLRARLPILLLPIAILATISLTITGRDIYPDTPILMLTAASGLACLLIAIRLDMADPLRRSRVNDYAFWLFVVGSPMTIHSLFVTILMNGEFDTAIWVVFGSALVAASLGIVLDRRPLVVSTLAYITIAVTYGTTKASNWNFSVIALVPLVIGLLIILLGVNWHRVRAALLKPFAGHPLLNRLPPVA